MTDDVTRGLTMLADEAVPAPIDSSDVITRARARTRNRSATLATAFATLAVVGSLAVTLNPSPRSTDAATADPTPGERLTTQLAEALPNVIPSRWTPLSSAAPEFHCPLNITVPDDMTTGPCSIQALYTDSAGRIDLRVDVVHSSDTKVACSGCDSQTLLDGTRTFTEVFSATQETGHGYQWLRVVRPNGTRISVGITYVIGSTPLNTDELAKWATVFSL
jgi:hypothetical protein